MLFVIKFDSAFVIKFDTFIHGYVQPSRILIRTFIFYVIPFAPLSSSLIITVDSQKDYHARRKHHHSRTTTTTMTTTAATSTTRSPASTTATIAVEQVEDNQIPEVTRWPTTEPTETWEITTTTISTTPSTTTTTTTPPREFKCV